MSDAQGRIQGALQGAGFGNASSTSSSAYDPHLYDTPTPKTPKPEPMHGPWAHGLDPGQAAGLVYDPTAMLPRVFKNLDPSNPMYAELSDLPVGAWGLISGKGTPQSIANKVGNLYQNAGTTGHVPAPGSLLHDLTRGKGLEDMFQGVKAGKGDAQSYYNPGYVSGKEPMPMGTATQTFGPLLDAALWGLPADTAAKYGSTGPGAYLIDKWGSKALKKPAGAGKPIYRYVGRHMQRM